MEEGNRRVLKGLEVIPRQKIDYKGIILEELDLDAILKRKPEIVLWWMSWHILMFLGRGI